jgi:hypothetical protein
MANYLKRRAPAIGHCMRLDANIENPAGKHIIA